MKIGRNDPCHCGSGKKYKHCCYEKDHAPHEDHVVVPADPKGEPADEEADGEQASRRKGKSRDEREEERARFRGGKGKDASYNPRVFRGAQRGN